MLPNRTCKSVWQYINRVFPPYQWVSTGWRPGGYRDGIRGLQLPGRVGRRCCDNLSVGQQVNLQYMLTQLSVAASVMSPQYRHLSVPMLACLPIPAFPTNRVPGFSTTTRIGYSVA